MKILKTINEAIISQKPENYGELCDIVNGLLPKHWGWGGRALTYFGYNRGTILWFHNGRKIYWLPDIADCYGVVSPSLIPIHYTRYKNETFVDVIIYTQLKRKYTVKPNREILVIGEITRYKYL